jgi:hypothetical protein
LGRLDLFGQLAGKNFTGVAPQTDVGIGHSRPEICAHQTTEIERSGNRVASQTRCSRLSSTVGTIVTRGDLWNIRPANREYDSYTIGVHEVGHGIGLGHPSNSLSVMTQTAASIAPGGLWVPFLQVTPFAGQPTTIAAVALAAGTNTYQNPRGSLSVDDAVGAITLYSAPIAVIVGVVQNLGAGLFQYIYTATNNSAPGSGQTSGYLVTEVRIPISATVSLTNLTAPAGWSISQTSNRVLVQYASGGGGLPPGNSIQFSFETATPPVNTIPIARWAVMGLESASAAPPPTDDNEAGVDPSFTWTDFGVIDEGTYNYSYNSTSDQWTTSQFPVVPAPLVVSTSNVPSVPIPGLIAFAALLLAAGLFQYGRRRA